MHFGDIENNELKSYLEKNHSFNNITNIMLKMFQGSIGRALKIKENINIYNEVNSCLENLEKPDLINVLNNSQVIYKQKDEINQILEYINVYLLEKSKEEYKKAIKYLNSIKIVEETKERLSYNSNFDMSIDNMLINIWEEFNN